MEHLAGKTTVLAINSADPDADLLTQAASVLRNGGLVAFPTETVYGLGANALDSAAVERIFAAKGRPADNPLIIHIADHAAVEQVAATIPPKAFKLMRRFWPGPLTLVLPKADGVPDGVTAGLGTVAVRMPDHPIALALIRAAGVPIAAPSANTSGRPSPTRAEHVLDDLTGKVDIVISGGETGLGLESTVLDLTVDPPVILRPGGVTPEQLEEEIGPVLLDPAVQGGESGTAPRSPGVKYAHYAPRAQVLVVEGDVLAMQAKIQDLADEFTHDGRRVGIMCGVESRGFYQAPVILEYGSRENLASVASDLFSTLRAFERHEVSVILAEGVSTSGIGLAIMNRLRKAAGGQVVRV